MANAGVRAQACVTSPPYFGLRDYGVDGQIGLEKTPEEYVAAMVEVFRCVRDVLADDGTLWLNIGDSYATRWSSARGEGRGGLADNERERHGPPPAGFKNKDLIGIPWMLAFALRADGWYLRQDIIWNKPNTMPESVRDRCTKAHEYIFLLSKQERYYFDSKAMKEPANLTGKGFDNSSGGNRTNVGNVGARSKRDSFKREDSKRAQTIPGQSAGTHRPDREENAYDTSMRNRRSVWTVATRPYKGAHFATFPPALIEPCVLAGSRPGDIVLDPFMGSGSTAEVAIMHGRQYAGCELNLDYKGLQDERIAMALAAAHRPHKKPRAQKKSSPLQFDLLGAD